MKYFVSLKRDEVLTHARSQMSLENVTLRGSSRTRKAMDTEGHRVSDSSGTNRQLQRQAAEAGCGAGEEDRGWREGTGSFEGDDDVLT